MILKDERLRYEALNHHGRSPGSARDKAAIISTVINKFEAAIAKRDFKDLSTEVIVLVDESHRGQYGEMPTRMKQFFPRACYIFIGFTGTPLTKVEKSTAARFGGIIDAYTIDQVVKRTRSFCR